MDTKVNDLTACEQELEVTLNYAEILPEIEEAYKKEKKKLAIHGFRKGKAPIQMIKKIFGDSIEYKASEDIANKKFWDVVNEKDLKPISTPQLTDLNFEPNDKLYFKVKYEIKPKFEVKKYKGLEIEKPVFTITDEMIEREVKHLLKSKAKFEEAEVALDENFKVTVALQKLNEKGEAIEGARREGLAIDLSEENIIPELKIGALGKKLGDKFDFTFVDEHKHGEETHREEVKYEVEVQKAEAIVYPEPSEEIIAEISNKKAKTLEEFQSQMKENYLKYYERQSENTLVNNLLNALVENNPFDVPQGYVEYLLGKMIEGERENYKKYKMPIDENNLRESLKPRAEWNAKWQIIMENLAEQEKISVEDSDIEKIANEEAQKTGISVEKLIKFYKNSNRKESFLEEKIITFLKENNKVVEVDLSKKDVKSKGKKK
ncbi:MAG: trigger factor [Bacteroidetes bacterium]|nr:trigger factor [Bacteroidota bacterium]MBU1677864.1 trigger factor [Bacteroidota bacterium]MBU2506332.1 trigger factor [Bacteroidota bacterium]